MRIKGLALVAVAMGLSAGCGGGGSTAKPPPRGQDFSAANLKLFALQAADLPSGYELQDQETSCPKAQTREQAAFDGQLAPLGRENCYGVTYHKASSAGYNDLGSGAFMFPDPGRASKALPLTRRYLTTVFRVGGSGRLVSRKDIPVSGLGDQSLPGLAYTYSLAGEDYHLFAYIWRDRNVVAFLGGGDFLGDLSKDTYLDIAKKIDFRATR